MNSPLDFWGTPFFDKAISENLLVKWAGNLQKDMEDADKPEIDGN